MPKIPFPLKRIIPLGLALLLLSSACQPDVELARWELDALAPLLETRLDFADLQVDTTLQADGEGQLYLVYRNKLAEIKPGEVAPPFNQIFTNSVKIETIELGRRVIREQITLGQVATQAGIIGQLILASHGTSQVIPSLTGLGGSSFTVDATEFFQSMTLRDGWLVLRMENGFPIDLSNVQYEIANQGGGAPLLSNSLALFPAGAVQFDSVRLQNNTLITGQLVANLVSLDSPGSYGNTVPVDTNDFIDLRVTIDKLDPVAATAIFPAQDLVQDTATANLMAPSAQLTAVHVRSGKLFMDATSTIEDEISLTYSVPSASQGGNSLSFVEKIPPAPVGGTSSRFVEVPVNGYDIDLTGLPGASNVFNEFYAVFLARVDSSGRLISLSLEDSVYIQTGIEELEADRGYGFLGYDSTYTEEEAPAETLSFIRSGSLSLAEAELRLELENYVGTEMQLQLSDLEAFRGSENQKLSWDQLNQNLLVPRATEIQPGQKPRPGRAVFALNESNSNVAELLSLRPDSFRAAMHSYLNRNVSPGDLSQFLYVDYGVEAYLDAEIPLHLRAEALEVGDTLSFDYAEFDPDGRVEKGRFKALATNFYPFAARLRIILLNEDQNPLDTLWSTTPLKSATVNAEGRASAPVSSEVFLPLDRAAVIRLGFTEYLQVSLFFDTPSGDDPVRFYSDNYLDLQLIGDFTLRNR